MASAQLHVRMDEDTKAQAQKILSEMGLDASTAVNIYFKQIIKVRGLPFLPSTDPFYSDSNITAIDEAAKQIERGQVVVKTLEDLEAMENG